MTPAEALSILTCYTYRCAEYDSMLRHRDAEAAIKAQADEAVAVLKATIQKAATRRTFLVLDEQGNKIRLQDALAELGLVSDGGK